MKKQLQLMSKFYDETLNKIRFHLADRRLSNDAKLSRIGAAIAETKGRKVCVKCTDIKLLGEFKPKENTFDGRASICEPCRLERGAKWRDKNRDKLNARQRERSKTPEQRQKASARQARWRANHPELNRERKRIDNETRKGLNKPQSDGDKCG